MKKIYLSPSDQVKNIYAGGKTNEAVQCRAIALALADALERCGFEAAANLTASMAERVAESNRWGADLHVCLHTNAFNAQVMGTRIFSYDLEGEGFEAAEAIFHRLAPITPGTSENIKPYPGLYEVKNSHAPCVYIETEFHDTAEGAAWITEHTLAIAEAVCHGICDHYGLPYVAEKEEEEVAEETRYQRPEQLPAWAIEETTELMTLGALKGNEKGLDVTEDMLRCMIVNLRATKALLARESPAQ